MNRGEDAPLLSQIGTRLRVSLTTRMRLFPWIHALMGKEWGAFCDAETDLCIEGFESSANSFVYNCFRVVGENLSIAHHKHVVANVKRAVHFGVPTVVLFRDPMDCIPSLVSRFRPGVYEATLRYLRLYDYVATVSDRVILVSFEEATQRIEYTLHKVAHVGGLTLETVDPSTIRQQAKERVKKWRVRDDPTMLSLPTPERDELKRQVRETLVLLEEHRRARELHEYVHRLYEQQERQLAVHLDREVLE